MNACTVYYGLEMACLHLARHANKAAKCKAGKTANDHALHSALAEAAGEALKKRGQRERSPTGARAV